MWSHGSGRRLGALWRQHDFRLFWFGESVNQIGNSLAVVVMSLLAVTVLDATPFQVGLLAVLRYLPWLLIGLPVGVWIDRLPSGKVMVVTDLVASACFASVPVAAWLDLLTIEHVLAVAFLSGTAAVFFDTAYQVMVPAVVDAADLMEGNAKLRGSASVAHLAGIGLGGLLAQAIGAATALLVNAASFLVSVACLVRVRDVCGRRSDSRVRPLPSDPRQPLRRSIAEGIGFVVKDPYLRPITSWTTVSNFGLAGYDALIMLFLVREVGVGPGLAGLLLTTGGVGAILGALLARRIAAGFGTARSLLLCGLVLSPPVLLVPLTSPGVGVVFYVIGMLVCVTGVAMSNVVVASFRQSYAPAGMLGRVTATTRVLLTGTAPAGALAGAMLGTWLGTRAALWIMLGLVASAGSILLTGAFVGQRDLPQAVVPAPAVPAAAGL
ncbi:MFS transporter [Nocardia sp. NPDC023852]|uniref:MFS transporter n=1 Tax=Nocardia sp. NPDC023852 TaxID=3154697 RepID=UPI0033CC87AF